MRGGALGVRRKGVTRSFVISVPLVPPSFRLPLCQVQVLAEMTPEGLFQLRQATPAFLQTLHSPGAATLPEALTQSSLESAKPPTGFRPLSHQRAERPVAGSSAWSTA